MQLLHTPAKTHASFDDPNLVSHADMMPVMARADRAPPHDSSPPPRKATSLNPLNVTSHTKGSLPLAAWHNRRQDGRVMGVCAAVAAYGN